MAGSMETVNTKLAINGSQFCFLRIEDKSQYLFVNPNGQLMCGTADDVSERIVEGLQIFRMSILLAPHPGELDILIPLIGVDESPTDSFKPNATGPSSFTTLIQRQSSSPNVTHTYANCKINQVTFRSQAGLQPLTCELDIMALTMSEGSSFSANSITKDAVYEHPDDSLTIDSAQGSSSRRCSAFVFHQNNHLVPRFNSSVTADVLGFTRREVHVAANLPYTSGEDDILTTFIGSSRADGVDFNMAYSRASKNLVFDFDYVAWEARPPSILNRQDDVRLNFFARAATSGSNALYTITQDNTV